LVDANAWQFWGKIKLYYFIFSAPSLSKNRFCTTEGNDIFRAAKIQHFSKINWNIARNIMCFVMNVIIAGENFSAHLIYLSISTFSYHQNMF